MGIELDHGALAVMIGHEAPTGSQAMSVVELRRYTLRPGQRDVLIELFDRELVETQEAVGMTVIGQFRDEDHPDTFTWLRGFADMESRRRGLTSFYGGAVWGQHRSAANATMIDSDDVLLLTPATSAGFAPSGRTASFDGAPVASPRDYRTITYRLARPAPREDIEAVRNRLARTPGWSLAMYLTSLDAVNDFPALAVRENEHVIVAVLAAEHGRAGQADLSTWHSAGSVLGDALEGIDVFRLRPTTGSRLR
jgi:NIPSNAP